MLSRFDWICKAKIFLRNSTYKTVNSPEVGTFDGEADVAHDYCDTFLLRLVSRKMPTKSRDVTVFPNFHNIFQSEIFNLMR